MHSGLGNVSEWHASIQNKFPRGMCEQYSDDKLHRADVLIEGQSLVIEVQHSPISASKASQRTEDWNKEAKQVVWILNGASCDASVWREATFDASHYTLHFSKPAFVKHFTKVDFVLIDIHSTLYIVRPDDMRNGYVHSARRWTIADMVEVLKDGVRFNAEVMDAKVDVPLGEFIVWQYPPGSGKTYGFTSGVLDEMEEMEEMDYVQFDKYGVVIVLTKEHAAKDVVHEKFISLRAKFGAVILENDEVSKAYTFRYKTKRGNERVLIIATLDSLIYKLADAHPAVLDMFSARLRSVEENGATGLGARGGMCFKGQSLCMNAQCLVIIDESTKPANTYRRTLEILRDTLGVSILLVGDKMQSTNEEVNLMTEVMDGTFTLDGLMAPKVIHKTVVRRFGDKVISLLKHMVDYEMYGVGVPEAHSNAPDTTVDVFSLGNDVEQNMNDMRQQLELDVDKRKLLPYDVLLVTPFVRTCEMTHEAEHMVDEVWCKRFENDDWVTMMLTHLTAQLSMAEDAKDCDAVTAAEERLVYFDMMRSRDTFAKLHFSDGTETIDTRTSRYLTRIVSIHSSQGDERRYCMVLGLSESKLTDYFTHGRRGLQYNSLIQVALSRAKEHLVVYIDRVYDDVWRRMNAAGYVETGTGIEPTLSLTKRVNLGNLTSLPDCDDSVNEMIRTTMQPIMGDGAQNPTLDFVHHIIRAAAFRMQFFVCAIIDKRVKDKQFIAIARKLEDVKPATFVKHPEYYRALREGDTTTTIPLLKKQRRQDLFTNIRNAFISARQEFGKIVKGRPPCWNTCSSGDGNNDLILQIVVMWHMLDVVRNGQYHTCKISTVYDIAHALRRHRPGYNNAFKLKTFYETLKEAESSYDSLCIDLPEKTNWLITHPVTLGKKNGNELNEFAAFAVPDFIIEFDGGVRVVLLRPQVSIMTMANVAFTTMFIRRILSQPKVTTNMNERFRNNPIDVTFVETSTGNQFAIPHFPIDGANVTAIMVEHIRATMRVRHTSIAHFCAFYKDREVAFEKYLSLHHLPPPYVQEAVTYKRTKRKRGCELGDYEDDLANALEDDCEQFQDDADKC